MINTDTIKYWKEEIKKIKTEPECFRALVSLQTEYKNGNITLKDLGELSELIEQKYNETK